MGESSAHRPRIEAVLSRALAGPATIDSIDFVGGGSNLLFRVVVEEKGSVPRVLAVRLPGESRRPGADAEVEARVLRAASAAGIAPTLLHADATCGELVTVFVDGARPVRATDVAMGVVSDLAPDAAPEGPLLAVAGALARLHALDVDPGRTFDPVAVLEDYETRALAAGVLPRRHGALLGRARDVARTLARGVRVPSHGDPTPDNVLVDPAGEAWLVDFEFATAADPHWDLAELASGLALAPTARRALHVAYAHAWGRHVGSSAPVDPDDRECQLRWGSVAGAISGAWYLLAGERTEGERRLDDAAASLVAE